MSEIVVWEPLHPEAEALLRSAGRVRPGLAAPVGGAAAIITRGLGRVTAEVLAEAGEGLRCVARVGAGTDNVDVAAATSRGIPVVFTPDAFTQSTAEHALLLMLAVARRAPALDAAVRDGRWDVRSAASGLDLAGRRLGIVGLGRIGRRFGEMALALDMEVVAWSRASRDPRFRSVSLAELLTTADVVSLHLSLGPETEGFLDRDRLQTMKAGAILVNVSRGALVDEGALAAALRNGRLRGAGLDVLAREPPPPDHPLLALPQVVVTPHVGALTDGAFRAACKGVAEAVVGHLAGRPIPRAMVRNPEVL